MVLSSRYSTLTVLMLVCAVVVFFAPDVLAADANTALPWDSPMKTILKSLTGPVAKVISAIAIVLAGLGLALGEGGGGTKKLLMIVLGISVAFGALSLLGGTLFKQDNTSQIDSW